MTAPDAPRLTWAAAACARELLLEASCDACARACPQGAIALGIGGPVPDLAACTRCGACIAACPEQVFDLAPPDTDATTAAPARPDMARFAPDHTHPLAKGPPWLAPIATLGLARLARLWLAGQREIWLAADIAGAGGAPPVPLAPAVRRALKDFNLLATARGLDPMRLRRATAAQTEAWLDHARARAAERPASAGRRALFRMAVAPAPTQTTPPEPAPGALARFQALPPGIPTAFAPQIDAGRCTACDDCLNICPHAALTMIKAPDGTLVYESDPAACTGCGLCVDICDEGAVSLVAIGQQTEPGAAPAACRVPLAEYTCRGCGVPSHTTAPAPPADGLCRICRQTGHYKKLFVVLD